MNYDKKKFDFGIDLNSFKSCALVVLSEIGRSCGILDPLIKDLWVTNLKK